MQHSQVINQIAVDEEGEFIATAADDGKVCTFCMHACTCTYMYMCMYSSVHMYVCKTSWFCSTSEYMTSLIYTMCILWSDVLSSCCSLCMYVRTCMSVQLAV